jgi:hypothetical protein
MRAGVLIEQRINVLPETRELDFRRAGEDRDGSGGSHELPLSEGRKLADRNPVASHDEGLPPVERAHDLAARLSD